jgi:two-component system, cell cycle sensor histidine kinase and response regulator CckA
MSPEQQQGTRRHDSAEKLDTLARAILDSALDCIITIDATGRVREFNPAAERVFGFTRAEAIGQELAQLIVPPRMREQHRKGLARYLQTGEGPLLGKRIEISALCRDGSEILVELAITPVKINGSLLFTSYLRDITERVRNDRRRLALYTVASLLAGSWTLEEASSQILETIATTEDWVFGAIWLYDDEAGVLRCEDAWYPLSERLEKFAESTRSTQLSIKEGLPGRVWDSKKSTWIYDVACDTNFPRAAIAAEVDLHGAFAFPLCADGSVNGIIEFFSHKPLKPDEDLLQMTDVLGIHIGLFIARRVLGNPSPRPVRKKKSVIADYE